MNGRDKNRYRQSVGEYKAEKKAKRAKTMVRLVLAGRVKVQVSVVYSYSWYCVRRKTRRDAKLRLGVQWCLGVLPGWWSGPGLSGEGPERPQF